MVQNMSFFCCPNCNHETYIFGRNGVIKAANDMGMDILGNVPLHEDVCLTSDQGRPIILSQPHSLYSQIYKEMADNIITKLYS